MTGASPSPPREGHYLVAIGVTTGLTRTTDQLIRSLESVTDLFRSDFGYNVVPGFGLDPQTQDVRNALRAFARERSPEDTVVVYHTGHADIVDEEHRLWMGDTDDPRAASLRASELVSLLLADTPLRKLMIILDACFAGTGGAEALMAGMRAGRRDDKSLVLITSAHPLEQVRAGDFAGLFTEAVHHPSTAGYEPRHLDPRGLVQHIQDNEHRPGWQTVSESTLFNTDRVPPFLPNPRYDTRFHDLDLRTQLQLEQGKLREEDLREHFLPRARGVISPVESDWRFEGRDAAMRTLSTWLGTDGNGAGHHADLRDSVVVVTGDMGSGKSAVLGRLVVLSDPRRRGSVPVQDFSPDTLPPPEKVTAAVHARLLTTGQVLDSLCAAAGVVADTLGEFLTRIGDRDLCVVIDALDEAMDPRGLVRELLRPLVDAADKTRLRLLLGCRRHVLDGLGDRFTLIDLDDDTYADRASVMRYARRCLTATGTDSPYHRAPAALTDQVAEAIGEAAVHSFLVALITATSLALRQKLPDPTDTAWRAALPRTAADAMRDDLEFRLGDQAQRALDLLVPLAFAQGSGLPWENVWPGLACQLSGRVLTDEDVVWLREEAGCYVVEAMAQERSVYRLYHAAMAEYVREGHDPAAVHDGFVTYLSEQVPGEELPAWERANPYTRRHLSTHARAAGRLDELVVDPGYLVAAERNELVAALPSTGSDLARQAALAYQRAVHRMADRDAASYLQLAAHRVGSFDLAQRITEQFPGLGWTVRWSTMVRESPHRVVARLPDPVTHARALMTDPDQPALLLVAHGSKLTLLDPDTGQRKASWRTDGWWIKGIQLLEQSGGPLVVVLDSRMHLFVLDARTLREEWRHVLGQRGRFPYLLRERLLDSLGMNARSPQPMSYGLSSVDLRSHPVVVTVLEGQSDAWDLANGTHLHRYRRGDLGTRTTTHLRVVDGCPPYTSIDQAMEEDRPSPAVRVTDTGGRSFEVTWSGPVLRVSDGAEEETGAGFERTVSGHLDLVLGALPLPREKDRTELVSHSEDGTIRVWDPDVFTALEGAGGEGDTLHRWRNLSVSPVPAADGRRFVRSFGDELAFLDSDLSPGAELFRSGVPGMWGNVDDDARADVTALVAVEIREHGMRRQVLLAFVQHEHGGEWDIWDPDTGVHLARCPGADTYADCAAATGPTRSGTYVVTSGHGDHLLLWRLTAEPRQDEDGRTRLAVRIVAHRRLGGVGGSRISTVAVGTTARGRPLAVAGNANGRLRAWSLPGGWGLDGLRFREWWRGLVPGRWAREGVRQLGYACTGTGPPLAVVLRESGRIDVVHALRGTSLGRHERKEHPPHCLAVRVTSATVSVAEADGQGRVRLWRLEPDRASGRKRYVFVLARVVDLEAVPGHLCFVGDEELTVTTQTGVVTLGLRS